MLEGATVAAEELQSRVDSSLIEKETNTAKADTIESKTTGESLAQRRIFEYGTVTYLFDCPVGRQMHMTFQFIATLTGTDDIAFTAAPRGSIDAWYKAQPFSPDPSQRQALFAHQSPCFSKGVKSCSYIYQGEVFAKPEGVGLQLGVITKGAPRQFGPRVQERCSNQRDCRAPSLQDCNVIDTHIH